MAHHTIKSGFSQLIDRLDRFPQGAPPSKLLNQILKMLFSEKEAELVSLLPIKPFTVEKASRIWKMDMLSAQNALNELADGPSLLILSRMGSLFTLCRPPWRAFLSFR